ncbi:hypothetical protein, partial [Leclercia adecarboxylata]|uniref:hypothetical protein n=1 Tax=Leclercia adecarboxylata TaxID=83655 RepID=UPI00234D532C
MRRKIQINGAYWLLWRPTGFVLMRQLGFSGRPASADAQLAERNGFKLIDNTEPVQIPFVISG